MNDFRTSATALETDAPHLSATQLVTRPGTLPSIVVPMFGGVLPDVPTIWDYLSEPAEFFGVPMPTCDELTAAIGSFAASVGTASVAVTVTIAELDATPQILVSGAEVTPVRCDAARIAVDDALSPTHRATDPRWRRMAARTTSRADADQFERWLNGRGCVDVLAGGVPLVGALVFDSGADVVAVEHCEPTSFLDQLVACGAIGQVDRTAVAPAVARRVWWISPRYETHPVAEVGGTRYPVDHEPRPPFTRWS